MHGEVLTGALRGLGAALLFGVSTPVAKLLLPSAGPFTVAALLYLGSGAGLLLLAPLLRVDRGAPLSRSDLPLLAGLTAAGGIAAPVLLMIGLARLDGASASLLLNLEVPMTIALAVGFFGERLTGREVLGAATVVIGGVLLGGFGGGRVELVGSLAVTGAGLGWALDNNLSQRLSSRDPIAVVQVKSVVAGTVNLVIAAWLGERLPGAGIIAATAATGLAGYGASIVLHMHALRRLGAARQGAIFATAPFAGAIASLPILGERLTPREGAAGLLMAAGVLVMIRAHLAHLRREDAARESRDCPEGRHPAAGPP